MHLEQFRDAVVLTVISDNLSTSCAGVAAVCRLRLPKKNPAFRTSKENMASS